MTGPLTSNGFEPQPYPKPKPWHYLGYAVALGIIGAVVAWNISSTISSWPSGDQTTNIMSFLVLITLFVAIAAIFIGWFVLRKAKRARWIAQQGYQAVQSCLSDQATADSYQVSEAFRRQTEYGEFRFYALATNPSQSLVVEQRSTQVLLTPQGKQAAALAAEVKQRLFPSTQQPPDWFSIT